MLPPCDDGNEADDQCEGGRYYEKKIERPDMVDVVRRETVDECRELSRDEHCNECCP